MGRAVVIVAGALALVAGAPAGAAAETVIAEEARAFKVSAHGTSVAWSRYRPESRRYALMIRSGGRVRQARVPAKRTPFEADLGVTAGGRLAVVYARCPGRARPGCHGDVHLYEVRSRRERRLTRTATISEYAPALWQGASAFARDGRGRQRLVHRDARGRTRLVPVGSWAAGATLSGLDLRGRTIVSIWHSEGDCEGAEGDKIDPFVSEMFAGRLGDEPSSLDSGCDGAPVADLSFPHVTPEGFAYVRREERPDLDPETPPYGSVLRRIDAMGQPLGSAPLPGDAAAVAIAGSRTYLVRRVAGAARPWRLVLLDGR